MWLPVIGLLLGIAIIALIYVGPKLLLPETMAPGLDAATRVVRYGLMAFTLTFFAPWLFVRLRLADAD